ncbi:MAG: AmmeMemoRadiSam system protein A [Actinomycetota bacterium]|nr:AmmeMemoRadiSam system protein A [Actinomycetota bacterium]
MSAQVFGIVAPHPPIMVSEVGGRRAHATADSAMAMKQAAELLAKWDPDTVVIMSPHAPAMSDAFVIETAPEVFGDLGQFGAPGVALRYQGDPVLADALLEALTKRGIPAVDRAASTSLSGGELDHAVLVPMSFLDPEGRWPLLVLSLSWLPYESHRAVGEELASVSALLGRKIAFVASGDCSHRLSPEAPAGFDPRAEEFDQLLLKLVADSDFDGLSHIDPELVERAGECGLRSFVTLGGVAAPAAARVLSYEAPWGVGYLTAVVNEELLARASDAISGGDAVADTPQSGSKGGAAGHDESEIVVLARRAIDAYLRTRAEIRPDPFTDEALPTRAGAFVSLHLHGALRGCIGTISPTEPTLGMEVVRNAIQAATQDPRFPPMTTDELGELDISVDVLHAAHECEFEDLDPAKFGVIVTAGWKRGLLLPDLEGVDTAEEQVDIASRKAGISPDDKIRLERFRVDRYI